MTIVDRYVLRLFLKVIVVCFFSLTGLYIVVDAFNNLDEFIGYGELAEGGVAAVLADYYGARVPLFFDHTSHLLALIAAVFAVTWLQRTNELTALMAAGINAARVVKSLIGVAIVVSLLAAANREFVLPAVRDKLARNAQNWMGQREQKLRPQFDHQTDILISGRQTIVAERKIVEPHFRLFTRWGDFGRSIVASYATYHPPQGDRRGGYLLDGVKTPEALSQHSSVYMENRPIILSPRDTAWLGADQCFVVSGIDFDELAHGSARRQYSSTLQLLAGLRNPSLDYGADVRFDIHARFVRPLLDMTLLFLGLPLVISRENRNLFVAAGLCLLVVILFTSVVLLCRALGTAGWLSPALAAWCPLIVFVPVAVATSDPLREA